METDTGGFADWWEGIPDDPGVPSPSSKQHSEEKHLTASRSTEKVELLWALGTGHHYYNHP